MAYRNVRIERAGEAATLLIGREGGNLLNIDVMEEMNEALLGLRGERGLEVLVVRGSGGSFCEGLDLAEHRRERLQRLLQVYSRIFETIRMIDMVTIAAVHGRAWGSGFEVALGCNLIVAAEDASFRLPEIERGVIPHIASIILPRVVPRRRAMEWILTGNEIPASELHRFGLINRLFPAAAFDDDIGSTDDPVRMYLREMGSRGLLSRTGEIALAKRIEAMSGGRLKIQVFGAGELILPTGKESLGLGSGVTIFEPFVAFGQLLAAGSFVQAQAGLELPFDTARAGREASRTGDACFTRTSVRSWLALKTGRSRSWCSTQSPVRASRPADRAPARPSRRHERRPRWEHDPPGCRRPPPSRSRRWRRSGSRSRARRGPRPRPRRRRRRARSRPPGYPPAQASAHEPLRASSADRSAG